MFSETSPRRKMSEGLVERRKAQHMLKPVIGQIGFMQANAARLRGIAARARSRGVYSPQLFEETEAMWRVVEVERDKLNQQIAEQSVVLLGNSPFVDARRSLDSIASSLTETRTMLGIVTPRTTGT